MAGDGRAPPAATRAAVVAARVIGALAGADRVQAIRSTKTGPVADYNVSFGGGGGGGVRGSAMQIAA
jgi:hypothetical protein